MKLLPLISNNVQVGFKVHAETEDDRKILDVLSSLGDRWKGWQNEPGDMVLYPEPATWPSTAPIN